MIQLQLFDMRQKTPYEQHSEMMAALRHAFLLFYQDATKMEPEVTGKRFFVTLPDGRRMTVQMEVEP
jgi:predicted SnoaL-like aldol condensation-catalyzing enzyme